MQMQTIHLSEVITDIAAGPFGSNLKVSCFVDDGFPIIDGANLKGMKVTDNITKYVTEEKARSLHRSITKRNDVVVTISGTLGQIAYIPFDSKYEEYLCSQRQFRVTFDTTKVYVPYLVFYFHTYEGQNKILSFANQVGVPALSQPLKNFRQIEISIPTLKEQKKIASIIESINGKIERNTAINDNLEATAQAYFDSLFFDESEPNCTLADIALVNPVRPLAKGVEARYFEMATLPTNGCIPTGDFIKPYNGGVRFINGDTLIARITPCLENGKAAYINILEDNEVAFGSTEYIVFASKGNMPSSFYYFLIRNAKFVTFALQFMNGSSGRQRVSGEELASFPLCRPSCENLEAFDKVASLVLEQMKDNTYEIQKLKQLQEVIAATISSC